MASTEFSFRDDLRNVEWLATVQLNGLRAVGAGLFWGVVMLAMGIDEGRFAAEGLAAPIVFPLLYAVIILPIGLIANAVASAGVPWVGLVAMGLSLAVLPGDPFVFVLKAVRPALVPVDSFRFVNLRVIIFVTSH